MTFNNLFADVFDEPCYLESGWQTIDAANLNGAPGSHVTAIASRRRLRIASIFFVVRVRSVRRGESLTFPVQTAPSGVLARIGQLFGQYFGR